jgi:hypothetical protein
MVVGRQTKQYFLFKAIAGCNIWRFAYFFENKHIMSRMANSRLGITRVLADEQAMFYIHAYNKEIVNMLKLKR